MHAIPHNRREQLLWDRQAALYEREMQRWDAERQASTMAAPTCCWHWLLLQRGAAVVVGSAQP